MLINKIEYSRRFLKDLQSLPDNVIKLAVAKEKIFKHNPLHPSLRLHELKGRLRGLWSISVSANYRIIFSRQENGDIVFVSIGRHDIYKYL